MADPHTPTTLVEWLDDLTVRFILNLPSSELSSVPRLCFQVEEAQWYYEDFVRPIVAASGAPPLPSLPLRQFCLLLFQHCPLFNGFSAESHLQAFEEFLAYKVRVPVRGAIMLDERMEKVVLVRGWKKGASWSFPRGKINKDEKDLHCAIREVWEETGFDIRAAGLVPENEDDAKAIDVTMREQHMRLFVFRGVPEDTNFEPKTRKEISKIQWYSIKDLPGFKKHKAGQVPQGDSMNMNKFYMVAPFLGHLKKWINQQRREDASRAKRQSANGHGFATQTATEDEGELETDTMPERLSGVDLRSARLKNMLSVGDGTPLVNSDSQEQQTRLPSDSSNLLAMLQGSAKPTNGSQVSRTPFEQINPFPQQPESPHPYQMTQLLSSEQQRYPPPQFPLSPHRIPEGPGMHHSLPTPGVFNGAQPNNQLPPQHYGLSPQMLHHHQQQQIPPQMQSMPQIPASRSSPFGQPNVLRPSMPFDPHQQRAPIQQPPPHAIPPQLPQFPAQQQIPHENAFKGPFESHAAMGRGPDIPKASQLPPPRQLGAEKIRLLDAFRRPSGKATPPAAPAPSGQPKQRPASTHQSALLDLFRKPCETPGQQTMQAPTSISVTDKGELLEPASPTGTDITVKPLATRRPTLNEITRTLPMAKPRVKSPPAALETPTQPPVHVPSIPVPPVNTLPVQTQERPKPPKERQLFDPNNPMKFTPANVPQHTKPEAQLPIHNRYSREFKNGNLSTSPSRNVNNTKAATENGTRATPPPFTILARPGSSKGPPKSPIAPASPLRNESPNTAFHPQVLKRPKGSNVADSDQKPADKKDRLLALFGKSASPTAVEPRSVLSDSRPASIERKESADGQKNRLLDLFNTSSNVSTPTTAPSQAQPRAPRIEPEQRPTSSRHQPTVSTTTSRPVQNPQQNLLLDLFANKKQGTPMQSPGTPISPFTLGTPALEEQKRRMGSLSALANVSAPGDVTGYAGNAERSPQENKDFLMGFLNGVVKTEGSRARK